MLELPRCLLDVPRRMRELPQHLRNMPHSPLVVGNLFPELENRFRKLGAFMPKFGDNKSVLKFWKNKVSGDNHNRTAILSYKRIEEPNAHNQFTA
jgi:hypothetical protein